MMPKDAPETVPVPNSAVVNQQAVVKQNAPEVPEKLAYEDHMAADTIGAQKEVAFYGAVANTWIATRMEVDKTLLTLSAAGLGLFLTLLTTVGVHSRLEMVFYGVGTLGFASAIGLAIRIFHRNADFLETLVRARSPDGDKVLATLDKALWLSFLVGALSAMLAGASAANVKYNEYQKQLSAPVGNRMPDNNKPKETKPIAQPPVAPLRSSAESLHESVDGFQKLRPQNLKPPPTAAPTTPSVKPSEPTTVKPTPKKA